MLVLAPTRELALQVSFDVYIPWLSVTNSISKIEKEAKMLLAHHRLKVGHAIGGTKCDLYFVISNIYSFPLVVK